MKLCLSCIAAIFSFVPLVASGQERACLIEGNFQIMGQKIYSKDCMQSNAKEPDAQFKKMCEQLAGTSTAFGGSPGKITYMNNCPKPAQGVCTSFFGGNRDAYYYARSASDLTDLPASCASGGGRWSSGQQPR